MQKNSSDFKGSSKGGISLRGICKSFGVVRANDQVSLEVEPGSIHGVIGENGAGKSTAMKVLYGVYSADLGDIIVDGKKRKWESPADAISAGIGMVHQHFMLARPYTALDNILLNAQKSDTLFSFLPKALRILKRKSAKNKLEALSKKYSLPVNWDEKIENLPVGIQQRIEILKLLYQDAKTLILDEPTAVLTPQEVKELFSYLKKIRNEGKTIIIITHKLKEVMDLTDRITVFRKGKVTGELCTKDTSQQELANLMVGRSVSLRVDVPEQPKVGGAALELNQVSVFDENGKKRLSNIDLEVRRGEVVGIAGVEGNGQSELLKTILFSNEVLNKTGSKGKVKIFNKDTTRLSTREIKKLGVGFIPEDRIKEGLLLEKSVKENFLLGLQRTGGFSQNGLINNKKLNEKVTDAIERYDVRPRDIDLPVKGLSGGNQQKLIIAREFEMNPGLIIAAQPTRGVDVGAIEFIHERILKARTQGAGVLLVSSELDEIITLSDRIVVLYEGRVVAQYTRGECDENELGLQMGGAGVSK